MPRHACFIILWFSFLHLIVAKKCLNEIGVHPKYARINDRSGNLTVVTSYRISHQLITHVFKICAEEYLGYKNITIRYKDDHFNNSFLMSNQHGIHVDLEVWMPPNPNVHMLHASSMKDFGSISPPGKFGWFIPKRTFQHSCLMEYIHWTTFQNATAASQFSMDASFLARVKKLAKNTYQLERCRMTAIPCAVLLAPKYADTKFVIEHIETLQLYVEVYWLEEELQPIITTLTKEYATWHPNKSLLFLSWTPSEIVYPPEEFNRVLFPSCFDPLLKNTACKYDDTRLIKLVSDQVKSNDDLINFLKQLRMEDSLWRRYHKHYKNLTIEQIACEWIQDYHHEIYIPAKPREEPEVIIGGIFPLSGNASLTSTSFGIEYAAEMAVNHINKNRVLNGYALKLISYDGRCESNYVMKAFIELKTNKKLLGILGPACSETVEPLAGVSKLYNILTISYSAEGVSFDDRTKYPFFFRTIGENQHYVPVYDSFFQEFNWTRIGALSEDGHKYTEYLSKLEVSKLENKKFPKDAKDEDLRKYLLKFLEKPTKIIIMDVTDDIARKVMCEAYHLNMTAYRGFVWFLPNWFSDDWYNTTYYNTWRNETIPCTTIQMVEAINGYLSLSHAFFAPNDTHTINNQTVGEWRNNYTTDISQKRRICEVDYRLNSCKTRQPSNYGGFAYDAIWTYALALKDLVHDYPDAVYTLNTASTTKKLVERIKRLNFYGVSGHINFGNGSSRFSVININQWLNGTMKLVGEYYPKSMKANGTLNVNRTAITWLCGRTCIPTDGTEPLTARCTFLKLECYFASLIIINVLIVLSVVMLLFYIFKRCYDKKIKEHRQIMTKKFGFDVLNLNSLDKWEIPRENVVINRQLGQGAFGKVYGGEAYFPDKGWMGVAVKTLKTGSTTEEKLDFLSEAEIMKRFDHKNIVKLLGVCTQNEPVYTVMEYMLYGDLKTFLLARRHLVNGRSNEDNEEISCKKLTSMSMDIARALSYLAEMKFVHRDIACRNCLVNSQRMVKLGDFGMTRPMFENDYYKFNRRGMLPVRWMSPESLGLGIFTPSSDIWSYGVLLYEIITFGSFPFQGKSNTEVLDYVKNGNVLTVPSGAKPQLEALIKSCWNLDPKRRPQASQIVDFLANYPRLLSPCLDVPLSSVDFCNTSSSELECNELALPETFRKYSVDQHFTSNDSGPTAADRIRISCLVRQQSVISAILSEENNSIDPMNLEYSYAREPLLNTINNSYENRPPLVTRPNCIEPRKVDPLL